MEVLITSVSAGGLGEIIVSFEIRSGENKSVSRLLISDAAYIALSISAGISDISTYDAVERESNIYVAYKKALYLLGYASSSRRALLRKLVAKGCEAEYANLALDRLEENGFFCESEFAIREGEKCLAKLWGAERIRAHLKEKGYSDNSISSVFFAFEDMGVDFDENCVRLIEKKYSHIPTDKKALQGIIASLMRYGYSLSQIKCALSKK